MRGYLCVLQHVLGAAVRATGLHGLNLAPSSDARYLGYGTGLPQGLLQAADLRRFRAERILSCGCVTITGFQISVEKVLCRITFRAKN